MNPTHDYRSWTLTTRRPRSALGTSALWLAVLGSSAWGCNAFDEPQETPVGSQVVIIPVDERPVETPSSPPLPITGGSMLALGPASPGGVIVADPERDRVSIFENSSLREVKLEAGDQPFRLTSDASGSVYVVLRGSGSVAKLDAVNAVVTARLKVCAEPRGIDYDPVANDLVVACAEGKLVRFKPETKTIHSEVALKPDLRDVVVQGSRIYVSRFRSAEVLFVENDELKRTVSLPQIRQAAIQLEAPAEPKDDRAPASSTTRTLKPSVAWRMVSDPMGGVFISHQRAVAETIDVEPHATDQDKVLPVTGNAASPYGSGSGSGCDAIVQSAVTQVDPAGNARSTPGISGVVLPVDLSISSDGETIALATAGNRDLNTPQRSISFVGGAGSADVVGPPSFSGGPTGGVHLLSRAELQLDGSIEVAQHQCSFATSASEGPTTSVAFVGDDQIVSLNRQASTLQTVSRLDLVQSILVNLGGETMIDTGHEIFHRDSGGGIACASCHPEATDDGHVWRFSDVGPRRTQHLGIPLQGTAPFHWDGSLPTLNVLMDEIFVERMGGVFQSDERLESLESWLFARPERHLPAADADAAARGEELFRSAETRCATCHAGKKFTDNKSYSVGTTGKGELLQVPPLQGLLLRPPYMHDGCAKTLHDRFKEKCGGGDAHGKTSHLTPAQVDDLVAYLSSL